MNYYDDENELTDEQREQVKNSILSKYQAARGDNSDIEKAEKDAKMKNFALGITEGITGLAAARAGEGRARLADSSGYWNNLKKGADSEVEKARLAKQDKIQNVLTEDKLAAQDLENDPNSEESKMTQALAKKLMPQGDFSRSSAAQLKKTLPTIEKMYSAEQASLARAEEIKARNAATKESKEDRQFWKQQALDEKKQKDLDSRTIGEVGIARTADDAKKLKEATETKAAFDRNLDEMIALREKHKGGALFNREDVKRGKQLSKEVLLQYKQLAKLGVLSESDMNILNTIIPEDPLEYDLIPGQDPILNNMKKFKTDKDADYETRLKTRLESRFDKPAVFPRQVRNAKTGEVATVSNDSELKEAQNEGFQ